MMRRLAVAVLFCSGCLWSGACSRAPRPGASVEYASRGGLFSASLPGGWKVDDAPGEARLAAFFGPPDGSRPFSELIAVRFFPKGRYKTPEDYLSAQAALGEVWLKTVPLVVAGVKGVEMDSSGSFPDVHAGPRPVVTRRVAFLASGGLFVIEHTFPADGPPPGPAFDGFLRSFKISPGQGRMGSVPVMPEAGK